MAALHAIGLGNRSNGGTVITIAQGLDMDGLQSSKPVPVIPVASQMLRMHSNIAGRPLFGLCRATFLPATPYCGFCRLFAKQINIGGRNFSCRFGHGLTSLFLSRIARTMLAPMRAVEIDRMREMLCLLLLLIGSGPVLAEQFKLQNAATTLDPSSGERLISIQLAPSERHALARFTGRRIKCALDISVAGTRIATPVLQEAITTGSMTLGFTGTASEATRLVKLLRQKGHVRLTLAGKTQQTVSAACSAMRK